MGGMCQAQPCPAANQSRRLNQSPTDAQINLVIGGRLCGQVPVRLDLRPVLDLRIIKVRPRRWPERRGYVWGLGVDPSVVQDLPDLRALGDERNQAHLPTAHRAQQREQLVDAGDQHRPQLVRRALGRHRRGGLDLGWECFALRHNPKCAHACTRAAGSSFTP
jgi:hypothetical protein